MRTLLIVMKLSTKDVSLLLLSQHDLETIEIGQIFTDLRAGELLSRISGSKFGVDFTSSPGFEHSFSAGGTRDRNDDASQVGVADEERHTRDFGALNENTIKIDNVKNDSSLSSEFTFLQKDNSTNFNKSFKSLNRQRDGNKETQKN